MLNVTLGSMRGGKSKLLIDYTKKFEQDEYVIFYPACLNKMEGYVYTRDKDRTAKAIKVFDISDMYNFSKDKKIILIDEVQFMCDSNNIDEFMTYLEDMDKQDKIIYCFGLNVDYLSRPFDVMQRILPFADTIVVVTAHCDFCGKPATRCLRYVDGRLDINPDSETLALETDNIEYKSVCKTCYRKISSNPCIS